MYVFATKKQVSKLKNDVLSLLKLVHNDIRKKYHFKFNHYFVGSVSRNLVTYDKKGNSGYDLDVNLEPHCEITSKNAGKIKRIFINSLNKYSKQYDFDFAEDSTKAITIKVKDKKESKILYSCDFAIITYDNDDVEYYIHYNKLQNKHKWERHPEGFINLDENLDLIKDNDLWYELKERYLKKKNNNYNHKKSLALLVETVNNILDKYFEEV